MGHTYLNPTTLELIIETVDQLVSLPGQFVSFLWQDELGQFTRSYSIVSQNQKQFTFTIKLSDLGRGAKILKSLSIGTEIEISGVFGKFLLTGSNAPKVFIATGTGLAPIYHMLSSLEDTTVKKSLHFCVSTSHELFYVDKLRALKNVDISIYVTREPVENCIHARIDPSIIEAAPDTEWHLCGNPKMVSDAKNTLAARGFTSVFSEEF